MNLLKWIRNSTTTKSDLGAVKTLNTVALSTNQLGLDYVNFLNQGTDSLFMINSIAILKNNNFSKFTYENAEDINIEWLENLLFLWGKACVFKSGEDFIVSNFKPVYSKDEKGIYWKTPKFIQPILPNRKKYSKILETGKDVAVFYNDTSFLFGKTFYGSLWRVWGLIQNQAKIYRQILNNVWVNRSIIAVPIDTGDDVINSVESAIVNGRLVIRLEDTGEILNRRNSSLSGAIQLTDRTESLWENFYNTGDIIKTSLGIKTNANMKKKERQITDEVEVNNVLGDSINETELRFRQKGIEQLNSIFDLSVSISLTKQDEDENEMFQEKGENNERE